MSESIPLDPERDAPADEGPTYDEIARRAYEIYESAEGGTPKENWDRAEAELRGEGS
jgi:hypothetical protein